MIDWYQSRTQRGVWVWDYNLIISAHTDEITTSSNVKTLLLSNLVWLLVWPLVKIIVQMSSPLLSPKSSPQSMQSRLQVLYVLSHWIQTPRDIIILRVSLITGLLITRLDWNGLEWNHKFVFTYCGCSCCKLLPDMDFSNFSIISRSHIHEARHLHAICYMVRIQGSPAIPSRMEPGLGDLERR